MPRAHLMTPLRRFADGESVIEVEGATVGEMIVELDRLFPGLGEMLAMGSSAAVDGLIHAEPEFLAVEPDADVYFVAPLTGG